MRWLLVLLALTAFSGLAFYPEARPQAQASGLARVPVPQGHCGTCGARLVKIPTVSNPMWADVEAYAWICSRCSGPRHYQVSSSQS